jgi:hypothetical protein
MVIGDFKSFSNAMAMDCASNAPITIGDFVLHLLHLIIKTCAIWVWLWDIPFYI